MKRTVQRALAVLLSLMLLLSLFPFAGIVAYADGDQSGCFGSDNDLTWSFSAATGTLTIAKDSGAYGSGNMGVLDPGETRPWDSVIGQITNAVISYGVTSIGSYAFYGCSNLTYISIANSVTSIGAHAFDGCTQLSNLTIPNSVSSIAMWAFGYCRNITHLTIPSSVTEIGTCSFYQCGLTSIAIPGSISRIGNEAFESCGNLNSVNIGYGVQTIGFKAFASCSGLTGVNIANSVTTIEPYAFFACLLLDNVTIPDSVTSIGDYAFQRCRALKSITVPGSVTSLGLSVFSECSNMTSAAILGNVSTVGSEMFNQCTKLSTAALPASIISIGQSAFDGCAALKEIYYYGTDAQWSNISVGSYNTPLQGAKVYTNAFTYTTPNGKCGDNLTWILDKQTGTLTIAGSGPMWNYTANTTPWASHNISSMVRQIELPNGLTSVGNYAFYQCGNVQSVTLPGNVTSLGNYAFYSCNALRTVSLPLSLTQIGTSPFSLCSNLTDIYYAGSSAQWRQIQGYGNVPGVAMQYGYYVVTFLDGNGNTINTQTVAAGCSATEPPSYLIPVIQGKMFVGWDRSFNNVNSDLTVTAMYVNNQYMVVFLAPNSGTLMTRSVEHGRTVDLPDESMLPEIDGKDFVGWFTARDGQGTEFTSATPVYGNISLYPYYETSYCTVTFLGEDGSVIDIQSVLYGSAATAPAAPVVQGKDFASWDVDFSEVNGDLTVTAQYVYSNYTAGDVFTFGSYPQSMVTDAALIAAMNELPKNWISYGYYSGTGNGSNVNNLPEGSWYSDQMTTQDYMYYADLTYNGEQYRAVYFTEYRPYYTGAMHQYNCQQANGYYVNTIYYFKYEPVQWRVLDPATGLVLCETIIDSQPYQNYIRYGTNASGSNGYFTDDSFTYYANNYEHSYIRSWLNTVFKNTVFDQAQQSLIFSTTLDNSSYNPQYNSAATVDDIFLLSYNEAHSYATVTVDDYYGCEFDNAASIIGGQYQSSDYALCQGLRIYQNAPIGWRLRTADHFSRYACIGDDHRLLYVEDGVDQTDYGIRPAMVLNLAADIFQPQPAHTVTFLGEDGTVLSTQNVPNGTAATAPSPPEVAGKVFDGWDVDFSNVTTDLTVTAQYHELIKELRADGRYYIDGVAVPPYYGLVEYEGDFYYIKDGGRVVQSNTAYVSNTNGLTFPDGTPVPNGTYEFDADGKLMMKQGVQADDKYYINGLAVPAYYGLVEWEGDFYYVKDNGLIVRSRTCYINTTHDLTLPNGNPIQNKYYEFDADGKMIIKQGIWSDDKYYIDGVAVPSYYGLVLWQGDFYYIKDNAKIVRSKTCQVNTLNGLTFPNGDSIKQGGYYEFDADGKMIVKQGIQADGKYYINGVAVGSYYGLVLWQGDYYYIKDNAQIVRSANCYVNTTNDLTFPNGDPVPRGYYDFDADGKLVIKQGIQSDGKYYINGVPVPSYYGLVLWEGDYYYIKDNAQIVRGTTIRVNTTNGLTFPDGTPITKGNYAFDADGKMVY